MDDTSENVGEVREALEKRMGGAKPLDREIRKARSDDSGPSNISGFISNKLLLRRRKRTTSIMSKGMEDISEQGKPLEDVMLSRQYSRTQSHFDSLIERVFMGACLSMTFSNFL